MLELPVYPASDLDRPQQLIAAIGSFWGNVYDGRDFVVDLLQGRAAVVRQAFADLQETASSLSRHTIPVFHKKDWQRLTIVASQVNNSVINPLLYDAGAAYDSGLQYNGALSRSDFAFACPSPLRNCHTIFDAPSTATVSLSLNIDFILDTVNGVVAFRNNPFTDPRFSPQTVFDGASSDQTLDLWLFSGDYETNQLYLQYGSVLGVQLPSSDAYKQLLNAVFDAMVQGTAMQQIQSFMSAITGIPLAAGTEVVQLVTQDASGRLVITDQNVYRFGFSATPLVTVGQTVTQGQALTDGLQIYELNQGKIPAGLQSLAVGSGVLAEGYYQDLVFQNMTVPTVVTTDANGFTELQFQIGGFPGDVTAFWDSVHAAGLAAGQTLADLLDTRPVKDGQPTAIALPTTINPLQFLISNVLRSNAFVVMFTPSSGNSNAIGFDNLRLLHKILPPQTIMFVVIKLAMAEGPLLPTQAATASAPGIVESLGKFLIPPILQDTINPTVFITERALPRSLAGRCQ
jgi:hypothetical protein